eukprot:10055423-Alexandrium_andersonii.AAC.1
MIWGSRCSGEALPAWVFFKASQGVAFESLKIARWPVRPGSTLDLGDVFRLSLGRRKATVLFSGAPVPGISDKGVFLDVLCRFGPFLLVWVHVRLNFAATQKQALFPTCVVGS